MNGNIWQRSKEISRLHWENLLDTSIRNDLVQGRDSFASVRFYTRQDLSYSNETCRRLSRNRFSQSISPTTSVEKKPNRLRLFDCLDL